MYINGKKNKAAKCGAEPRCRTAVLNAVFGRADKKLENDGIKDNSD